MKRMVMVVAAGGRGGRRGDARQLGAAAGEAWDGGVGAGDRLAIGADVLKDGGNAIDAAVAVGFALAVTHPTAGNLGAAASSSIALPTASP